MFPKHHLSERNFYFILFQNWVRTSSSYPPPLPPLVPKAIWLLVRKEKRRTKQNKTKHLAPLWTYSGYFLMYTEAKKKTWADFNGTTIITTTTAMIIVWCTISFPQALGLQKTRPRMELPGPLLPPSPVLWWCPKIMSLIGVGVLFRPLSGSYSEQEPTLDGYQGGS
jgi:hypothetical protein